MLLLDTHALLWWLADDPALSPAARTAIAAGQTQVFVSAASAWEMSIKSAQGRLDIPDDRLKAEANEWSITRGARSGRVAWQFIQDLAGRLGKPTS